MSIDTAGKATTLGVAMAVANSNAERLRLSLRSVLAGATVAVLLASGALASPAAAAPALEVLQDHTHRIPPAAGDLELMASVMNTGDSATTGDYEVRYELPDQLTPLSIAGTGWTCDLPTLTCTRSTAVAAGARASTVTVIADVSDGAPMRLSGIVRAAGGGATPVDDTAAVLTVPEFDPKQFTTSVVDAAGVDEARAGATPFSATASFGMMATRRSAAGLIEPIDTVRTIVADLPPGFVGNPQAVVECKSLELVASRGCPVDSLVGFVRLRLASPGSVSTDFTAVGARQPIYNLTPGPGYAAAFGVTVGTVPVRLNASIRTDSDFGVTVSTYSPQGTPLVHAESTFCGYGVNYDDGLLPPITRTFGPCVGATDVKAFSQPFLSNPVDCAVPDPTTVLTVNSWENPDDRKRYEYASPQVTNCDALTFEPAVDVALTTTQPDAPTGIAVDMSFPHNTTHGGLAIPPLKKAVVTLPEGMSINPAGANGLAACSDGELNLRSKDPVTCPDAAKIGTVTATSPLLKETLKGGVYIRSQNSDDPESGEMFRLALVLENRERGLSIRLPGQVRADRSTGRLVTTFDNNPQLPVADINLRLKDGPTAPLVTPPTCGTKTIDVQLVSWGGQTAERPSTFGVDCTAGLGGFAPTFGAGAVNPVAGVFSPFAVNIAKPDGDSALGGISLKMPTGLLAKIKGNLGTQVGSVMAFAGPGSQPFMLPGTVTLEGAYGDAPYSLRVVVPAKAGPFDLGDVVVRQKVYVDPVTAEVTVVSDPVPTIVKGVPARMQRLDVDIDKPGFMINPTSCETKEITGTLDSLAGQTAAVRSRFQVGECASLPFNPKLAMRLTGRKQLTTGKHPGVRAQVNQTGVGEAGINRAKVTLPKSLALDPENAQALCEFEDGTKPDLENHCPAGSIVGRARATTPLLERDLVGNVYFVKNVRKDAKTGNTIRTLPMIVVALRGEIAINLKGESSTTQAGRLINTFNNVPDAPITKFNLNIAGGQNGILAVTRTRAAKINVCAGRQIAQTNMNGHNGRRNDFDTRIKTPCAKSAKKTKKAKRSKRK